MRLSLRRRYQVGGTFLSTLFGATLLAAQYLHGHTTTLTVTTTADDGPGSLRAALASINDGDTIEFDPALNGGTITLSSGELIIDKNIALNGPGPDLLTVSSFVTSRIIHLAPGHNATITGLTIRGGFSKTGGGGVLNDHAILTIDNCVIQGNASAQDETGKGGGIYNDGSAGSATLTILNSTIVNNRTGYAGGGIYNSDGALLNLTNSAVNGNQAVSQVSDTVPSNGGGIANSGTLVITGSSINDNLTGTPGPPVPSGSGGGVSSEGLLTISDSTITGNVVALGGGGIFVAGTATITNVTVASNQAFGSGDTGPLGSGGGILVASGGNAMISNTIFSGNTVGQSGGGIANEGTLTASDVNVSNNSAPLGGGINNRGAIEIRNSSVFGNTASGQSASSGGGLENADVGTALVSNSTISGNYSSQLGAAISNHGTNRVTVTNSTISGNRADEDGGIYNNAGHLELANTILKTGTSGANIVSKGGIVTSRGYNLSDDDGAGFLNAIGDQINTDPFLGPLAGNGGLTLTHALLPNSPAIDRGDPDFTPPPVYDQRGAGYDRVKNGRIDIGSFEQQSTLPTPTPGPSHSLNLSTRMFVQTGAYIGIGGFIITPTGGPPKQVLIRAIGPSLGPSGIPDFLADPTLQLRDSNAELILENDNWRDTQQGKIEATGLAPNDDLESAILATLTAGNYTALLAGKNDTTGVALIEIYDLGPVTSQLGNMSTRAFVGNGDNVVIGGFILGEGSNTNLEIRAIGPSLGEGGLEDPTLELRDINGGLLASNDNCAEDSFEPPIFPPPSPLESCIDISLSNGLYTAILAGENGGTGLALVEIYNLQSVPIPTPTPSL